MSDPFLIPSIITGGMSAAGNIIQGLMNKGSQQDTNAMQIELANTAIQRRQKDLEAAGINPLMAGRIGGADTPTLQAPQMTGIPQAVDQITPNAVIQRSQKMQEQQMTISQIEAQKNLLEEQKNLAIAEALAKQADAKYQNTAESLLVPQAESAMKLQGAQKDLAEQQKAESTARTLTENMSRDPKIRLATAEATSAEWKAKADEYLPDIQKATKGIEAARATWASVLNEAQAKQATTLAKIMVNDLVKSDQLVNTDIAKARAEFAILTSKSGQEALATQLAQATYGANVAKPYIDNILKAIQGASIVKDLIMPSVSGISNSLFKAWGW